MSKRCRQACLERLEGLHPRIVFFVVLGVALLARLALLLGYQVAAYSDTNSYRRLSRVLLGWMEGGSGGYDGTRVPGYALFLALAGPDQAAWLAQMGMGVLITLLLFYIGWKLSGRAWFGGLGALMHTLNLGQLFFESNLLTETLSTFWITLALAGLVWGADLAGRPHSRVWSMSVGAVLLAAGIGLAIAAAVLTRPLFVYLPVWLALCMAWTWQPEESKALIRAEPWRGAWQGLSRVFWSLAALTLAVALPVLGWVRFIYNTYGFLSLTVMTGYHLVQHTGVFFEYVPDEQAVLRDTYLRYRDEHIAEYGTQTNTIWGAIPELSEVSGLNFYDLSRELAGISADLIREHPDLYLRNVLKGWGMFWLAPVYWSPELLRWTMLQPVVVALIWLERAGLVLANLLFITASLGALLVKRLRQAWQIPAGMWALAGTVWLASLVQTLLDHGDNPRFLIPLQSVVVIFVLYVLFFLTPNPSPKGGWAHLIPSPRGRGIGVREKQGGDVGDG